MDDVFGIGKAVETLVDPVSDFLKRIAGPAADEIGLALQDSVHVWRAKRAHRFGEKFLRSELKPSCHTTFYRIAYRVKITNDNIVTS